MMPICEVCGKQFIKYKILIDDEFISSRWCYDCVCEVEFDNEEISS